EDVEDACDRQEDVVLAHLRLVVGGEVVATTPLAVAVAAAAPAAAAAVATVLVDTALVGAPVVDAVVGLVARGGQLDRLERQDRPLALLALPLRPAGGQVDGGLALLAPGRLALRAGLGEVDLRAGFRQLDLGPLGALGALRALGARRAVGARLGQFDERLLVGLLLAARRRLLGGGGCTGRGRDAARPGPARGLLGGGCRDRRGGLLRRGLLVGRLLRGGRPTAGGGAGRGGGGAGLAVGRRGGGAGLGLLDDRDEVVLAQPGGALEAHLGGQGLQLGQAHAAQRAARRPLGACGGIKLFCHEVPSLGEVPRPGLGEPAHGRQG